MSPTQSEIACWCRGHIAHLLDVPEHSIDADAEFDRIGVDSALAVSLLVEVEEQYGVELQPEALFEHPSINAIAEHLAGIQSGSRSR